MIGDDVRAETLAEQLITIDTEIFEMKSALSDPQTASQAAEIEAALAVALMDRADTVEKLEALGLEDPNL